MERQIGGNVCHIYTINTNIYYNKHRYITYIYKTYIYININNMSSYKSMLKGRNESNIKMAKCRSVRMEKHANGLHNFQRCLTTHQAKKRNAN